MKTFLTAGVAALVLSACANTLEVHSDHDAAQSFVGYHTFAWMADQPMMSPPDEVERVSPLNRRRIELAIEAELARKGFRKAAQRAAADFVVSYTVGARDRLDVQSYPEPYRGPWYWGGPYFTRQVDVTTYREGMLAIDIFDGRSHQPVWHGWGSKPVSERDVQRAAQEIPPAVASVLANFPPG